MTETGKKKLTKEKIEQMAMEILDLLKKYEVTDDTHIYYNDKRISTKSIWDWDKGEIRYENDLEENICPLDYFEYANSHHILSMSFEGRFYDVINYGNLESVLNKFDKIFKKYGVYYEQGHSWNLSCYPDTLDESEIEFTDYTAKVKPDPIHLYMNKEDILPELKNIMIAWWELSKVSGDGGSCVLGAGFKFKYRDNYYFMSACSPWQGSISWERHTKVIETMLSNLGATEISYDWGRMD